MKVRLHQVLWVVLFSGLAVFLFGNETLLWNQVTENVQEHNKRKSSKLCGDAEVILITYVAKFSLNANGLPSDEIEKLRQSIMSIRMFCPREYINRLRIVVYCVDDTTSQLLQHMREYLSAAHSIEITVIQVTDKPHFAGNATVGQSEGYRIMGDIAIKNIRHSPDSLLLYLPELISQDVGLFFFFATDVVATGDLKEIFDIKLNETILLASKRFKHRNCSTAKMMSDHYCECISTDIVIVNRRIWTEQNRTSRLEKALGGSGFQSRCSSTKEVLVREFSNQWVELPQSIFVENFGNKEIETLQSAQSKGFSMIHPSRTHFLESFEVWFQVTISSEHDGELIPHIINYYKSQAIPIHKFLVVLHSVNNSAPFFHQAESMLQSYGVEWIYRWIGEYSSASMFKSRVKLRKWAGVRPTDWVVHADSDQFNEFPLGNAVSFLQLVDDLGYDAVYGYYIDRVSSDGTLHMVKPEPSLFEQFPLSCFVSTQVVKLNRFDEALNKPSKLVAFKGKLSENRGGGQLLSDVDACVFPARLRSHHFKWIEAVVAKMKLRVVVEQKMAYHYQAVNVLQHLEEHNGKIGVNETRLQCQTDKETYQRPASSLPVNSCAKYKKHDDLMSMIDPKRYKV